jgi:hypothetical protein
LGAEAVQDRILLEKTSRWREVEKIKILSLVKLFTAKFA